MFGKNKIEKEYIARTEKIKLPYINGEDFRKISITEKNNNFRISKYIIRVACICIIFVFATFGIGYYNNENDGKGEEANVIRTALGIKAYAYTTNGTESVDLEENKKVELPSGKIKNGGFNMKGLEISGDKKIKNIKALSTNGSVSIASENITEGAMEVIRLQGDNSEMDLISLSPGNSNTETAKYVGDETMKRLIDKLKNNENIDEDIKKIENGEYDDLTKKDIENFSGVDITNDNYNSLDLDSSNEYSKVIISWTPKIEVLKELSQRNIDDFSKLEGDSIKIQVTFEDGTIKENTLDLSFSKEGNIIFELK